MRTNSADWSVSPPKLHSGWQIMRNLGSSKKYTEGFVAWNERPRLQGEAQSVGDRTSMSGRGIMKKKTSFPSSLEYVHI